MLMKVLNNVVCLYILIFSILKFFEIILPSPHLLTWYLIELQPANSSKSDQNVEKSRLNFLILLMDVPGRISRYQNRRNYVVNWIVQILISDYHRAMLSLGFWHLGSSTAANWVSFDLNVSCSSCWGYSLINTLKLKKKRVLLSVLNRHPVVKPTQRWTGAEQGADSPWRMRGHHPHP